MTPTSEAARTACSSGERDRGLLFWDACSNGVSIEVWTSTRSGFELGHPKSALEAFLPPVRLPALLRIDLEQELRRIAA